MEPAGVFEVTCEPTVNDDDPQVLDIKNIMISAVENDESENCLGLERGSAGGGARRKKIKLQIQFDFKLLREQQRLQVCPARSQRRQHRWCRF